MVRKEKKYHYIYKTTCSVTNRYYIGMHSTDNLTDGYIGSGKRLWFSINYHGRDNHTKEILEFCENRIQLRQREAEIVNEQLLNEDLCMNLMTGGQGGLPGNPETLKKLREGASNSLKEKWQDSEYREKISKLSGERMEQYHKQGKIKYDTFTGKKHSEQSKKKMSEIAKQRTSENNSKAKAVSCYDLGGNLVKHYKTMKETESDGFNANCVSDVCKGRRKTHKKHVFKYK